MRNKILITTLFLVVSFLSQAPTLWAQPRSNQPATNLYKSQNFRVVTDLPKADAEELLVDLEKMLKLVVQYWGRRNRMPIRMFVFDDFANWSPEQLSQMDAAGVDSARTGGGLTITRVLGVVGGPKLDSEAIVYATSKRKTPQHEAIHAYCGINFGSTGPVWYSEGMAEVGKYFQAGERGVNASDYVIEYLQSQTPKPLGDIVNNPLERTGDSWQNYAWRWVICHMLGANSNYAARFKPLGLALLADKNVSFAQVYGTQAEEIEFEYKLFLKDMEPGYRCDLCSWDWKAKFRVINNNYKSFARVQANKGWQASRGKVTTENTYLATADGQWSIEENGDKFTAFGNEEGKGKLVGIVFNDYELSEPFEIEPDTPFTVPMEGDLFLRCQDAWGSLVDNKGTINVRVSLNDSPMR